MHLLFEAPATDVTLDMVQDFVDLKIREGLTVEYKRAGDKPIEAVAALANTYGGLLLVGVAEGERGVPSEILGAPMGEKEKLINQMATRFDPPWTPEVIEVPCGEAGDKVVLVVRIDRATVPRPVVLDGAIFVRLDARNAKANRQMMRMLLDEPTARTELPSLARHSLRQYASPFRDDGNDPNVALRAVSTMALWSGEERVRFPSGIAAEVVRALQGTRAQMLLSRLGLDLSESRQAVLSPWEIVRATSRSLWLRMSTVAPDGGVPSRPGAQMVCRMALEGEGPGLQLGVNFDTCIWLPDATPLGLDHFVQVMYDTVPIVANTLLPAVAAATVGVKAMPTPLTEIHTAVRTGRDTYGDAVAGSLDRAVFLRSLGDRTGGPDITQGGEVLLRSLVEPPRWDDAVREALVTMAMDWGFLDPKFP
jgi:hypothetical protein